MENEKTTRRTFLNRLWLAAGVVAAAEIAAMTFSFFRPRKPRGTAAAGDTTIVAGPVENFEPGSVTAFVRGKFYLARLQDGGFLALSRSCTHLNCTVPWITDQDRFICPCHSSAFDIHGAVIDPPATRALDRYPVRIQNNIVQVDVSEPLKRNAFDSNQVTYPGQA